MDVPRTSNGGLDFTALLASRRQPNGEPVAKAPNISEVIVEDDDDLNTEQCPLSGLLEQIMEQHEDWNPLFVAELKRDSKQEREPPRFLLNLSSAMQWSKVSRHRR